jgi:hypothetical protein
MTIVDNQPKRPSLPARIEKLFAAAEITLPTRGPIPLSHVDYALKGLPVDERLYIKGLLRERGLLA